jgi:hypothetical protein
VARFIAWPDVCCQTTFRVLEQRRQEIIGMKAFRPALLPVLLVFGIAAAPGEAQTVDANCIKQLTNVATKERQRVAAYTGEMKNMTDNPWAKNSISTCSSSLSRADRYFKRQTDDRGACVTGSSYVDNQVVHLFHNAGSTCRQEFEELVQRLPPDEQRVVTERAERKAAEPQH